MNLKKYKDTLSIIIAIILIIILIYVFINLEKPTPNKNVVNKNSNNSQFKSNSILSFTSNISKFSNAIYYALPSNGHYYLYNGSYTSSSYSGSFSLNFSFIKETYKNNSFMSFKFVNNTGSVLYFNYSKLNSTYYLCETGAGINKCYKLINPNLSYEDMSKFNFNISSNNINLNNSYIKLLNKSNNITGNLRATYINGSNYKVNFSYMHNSTAILNSNLNISKLISNYNTNFISFFKLNLIKEENLKSLNIKLPSTSNISNLPLINFTNNYDSTESIMEYSMYKATQNRTGPMNYLVPLSFSLSNI